MSSSIAEALAPLRARMPQVVREQEILRVAAAFPPGSGPETIAEARRIILAWAQRRAGGRLPPEAWAGSDFEYLSGGRTTIAVKLVADPVEIWALRADDPDKNVAGRIWTTEATIGQEKEGNARLSVRLLASTAEDVLDIEPHAPGFIQQLANDCGVRAEGFLLRSKLAASCDLARPV